MGNRPQKYLVVILGPTAVGKTAVAIELAKTFQTDILSADSRQIYREMTIGTAKPSAEEIAAVPHHFIDHVSIHEEYNAGRFEHEALAVLKNIYQHKNMAIMAGGSGLYVNAVLEGLDDLPQANPETRQQLNTLFKEKGLEGLQQELKKLDPDYFKTVDLQNHSRLLRALEVCLESQQPYSSLRKQQATERPFQAVKIGLKMDREALYNRINKRVDDMMQEGLLSEVKSLFPYRHLKALQTVGYQELFEYLEGQHDLPTAVDLIKRNSRRYAKRQLTWNRKDSNIRWFHPAEIDEMKQYLCQQIPIDC